MIPIIRGLMLAVSNSPAASIVAKVTVVTALGLISAWLARGNRAAVRHALLAATFGVMLLLPIAAVFMPPLHVGVPVGLESRAPVLPLMIGVDTNASLSTVGTGARVSAGAPRESKLLPANLLFAGWVAGVALFLLPVVVGLCQIGALRRSGLPWRDGQSLVEPLARDAGIRRRVEVLLDEALPGPMTSGVVRPAIVLPRDAEDWNAEDLNRAIVHELEHVRRGDSLSCCLARAICAVYWFHPLVWIAWRKLVLEAERSCDDAVLRRWEATEYADQLVGLARRVSQAHRSPLLAMANRADLSARISAVLDDRLRRGRAGTLAVVLTGCTGIVLAVGISPLILVAAPQTPRSFEVASVKASKSADRRPVLDMRNLQSGGQFTAANVTVRRLIQMAYDVKDFQILGSPGWTASDLFDIAAKPEGPTAPDQLRLMLQSLLAQRFHLGIRRDAREMPIYALVVGRNGPKFKEAQESDPNIADVRGRPDLPSGGPRPRINIIRRGRLTTQGSDMTYLSAQLSNFLGRTVLDKTGLKGTYDLKLEWVPDENQVAQFQEMGVPEGFGAPPPDWPGPTLFTALEEQLGLRLDSEKGSVEVLVIERIEKPSEN